MPSKALTDVVEALPDGTKRGPARLRPPGAQHRRGTRLPGHRADQPGPAAGPRRHDRRHRLLRRHGLHPDRSVAAPGGRAGSVPRGAAHDRARLRRRGHRAPPDPCDVAEGLVADGIDVKVETVGLLLEDDASRSQLECIAEATGGSFRDVDTATALADELETISVREARRFAARGTELEGAPVPAQANTGEAGTTHVDTVLGHEDNYYRFEIAAPATVGVDFTLEGQPVDGLLCPDVYLVDRGDQSYDAGPFQGDDASATQVKVIEPVEVAGADEVWLKVETDGCSGRQAPDAEFPIQFAVTATGSGPSPSPTASPTVTPTPTATAAASPAATPSPVAAAPAVSGGLPGWAIALIVLLMVVVVGLGAMVWRLRQPVDPKG